tara:strand:+ start:1508 stop:1777 length:270 start_codon:yes stop_codon:yes gene_type:complete
VQNLPSESRASTKILKDLFKLRKKLIAIENSGEPYVSKLRPLLRQDYYLSHALIKILNYENDFNIKFKSELKDKFSDEDELEKEEIELF